MTGLRIYTKFFFEGVLIISVEWLLRVETDSCRPCVKFHLVAGSQPMLDCIGKSTTWSSIELRRASKMIL